TGAGFLTKSGTGTLTIANDGVNDFTGPIAIGSGGTLQVGNGGTSGSIGTGAITNDGVLVINRSDGAVLTNTITGPGAFQINAGSVAIGAGTTSGSLGSGNITVAANATLAINKSDLVTLPQIIAGSGNLVK